MKRLFLALAIALFPGAAYAESTLTVIDFNGEIVDQNAAPVSGVLPLEFRVFADSKAKKALAVEKHYVSVVDGSYMVSLGEDAKIQTNQQKLYVAVYLDNKELMRQEVDTQRQLVPESPKTATTERAGGDAGEPFRLECPAGYVVTGIEGNAKTGISGLKLICSKAVQL
ncbi:MAG: hypothetical protein IJ268_11600 [Proteobacteria bacterium]|nr:hypothetical protein [Pseudomonadota bacterium]MBQ9243635.1 hypothetical protein [Pseudomonadota bacterium]